MLVALLLAAVPMAFAEDRDPITDDVRAAAFIQVGENSLVVGCDKSKDGDVRVMLVADKVLAGGNRFTGEKILTHRFDQERARENIWRVDGDTAYLVDAHRVGPFIKSLVQARRVVIRTADYRYDQLDMIFPIEAAREPIERMLAACSIRDTDRYLP